MIRLRQWNRTEGHDLNRWPSSFGVMDRADELRRSLPSLLNQDYPDTTSSSSIIPQDGLLALLKSASSPRRPLDTCASRILQSLFFWQYGMRFRDEHHLQEIVAAFESSDEIDDRHYERWQKRVGYATFTAGISHEVPDLGFVADAS